MPSKKALPEYKLVVIGGGAVGKSCLTLRLIRGTFVDEYDPTIEDSFRKQCIIDDETVMLDVFDTAGQEEYLAQREDFIRRGEAFLLVYSVTSRHSFEEVKFFQQRIQRVKEREPFTIIVVGNKSDLKGEREVSTEEGNQLASQFGCRFIETSAKSGTNVENAFYDLVRDVRSHNRESTGGAGGANGASGQPSKEKVVQDADQEAGCKCAVM